MKKAKVARINLGGKNIIEFQTSMLNKHGELKGRNKKETALLRDTCMHHKKNKKGKNKSRVELEDGQACCAMCQAEFRAQPYSKSERKEIIGEGKELANHTKFMAAACGADEQTLRSLAEISVGLTNLGKINKSLTKIVSKEDAIKKKNKKNKGNTSESLGSWRIR